MWSVAPESRLRRLAGAALPNQQIDKMIPFMAQRYGVKMFFAGNNYEWPRGSIDAAKRVLQRLEGTVVGEEYLSIGASEDEIEQLLEQLACSGADVFVPYFAGSDQLAILTRFAERGLKQRMAVVMGHYDEMLVRFQQHLFHVAADGRKSPAAEATGAPAGSDRHLAAR